MVVTCQSADTVTTLQGMERGARELNPFVAAILEVAGPMGFIAAKAGVTLVVLHYHAEISTGLLAAADVVTCGAAANNARVASKLPPAQPTSAP